MQDIKFFGDFLPKRRKTNSINSQLREKIFELPSELKMQYERKKQNDRQNRYCFICTFNINGYKGKKGSGLWKGEIICAKCVVNFLS